MPLERANYRPPKDHGRGCVPRDLAACPMGAPAPLFGDSDIQLIDKSEWGDRLAEKKKHRAQLSDVRNLMGPDQGRIPALNQGRDPFCWAFSPTTAITLARASAGAEWQHLSANAVGNKCTGFKVRGGYSADSMEWIQQHGVPEVQYWPEQDNAKHFDNPDTWENAKQHVITSWVDIDPRDTAAIITCLLLNYPIAVDIPAWAHSVCLMDLESINPLSYRHLNSWGDNWNGDGTGLLKNKYTKFASAIACLSATGE